MVSDLNEESNMESASSITKYDKSEKNKRSKKKKRSRNHSLVRTKTGTRIPEVSKKAGYRTAAYKTPHRCLFSPRAGPRVWVLPYHPFSGHGCLLDFQQPSYEKVIDTPENHSENKEL